MKAQKIEWICNNYVTVLKGNSLSSVKCGERFRTLEVTDKDLYTTCPACGEDLEFKTCGKIIGN